MKRATIWTVGLTLTALWIGLFVLAVMSRTGANMLWWFVFNGLGYLIYRIAAKEKDVIAAKQENEAKEPPPDESATLH